ncbi:SDR family NAD(P)-dependent oxidoreductase [Pelagicoccus mobilis]|uniref:SDR family oxidoreductase n=1 Tax=Pelagicoccus mobilis TaxID=415221 RepID=A0A934VR72_9BACT|nr:SDR family NAD(P)-dependent oxidoreductase [Pelagicoccus mobilis]MBK1879097.1 SDR family oxidoreductase [Pelagicoccus mobilis]
MSEPVMSRFTGQSALITGGAGDIGKAIGKRLSQEGAHVTLLDLSQEALDRARLEFIDQALSCDTLTCDLSEQSQVNEKLSSAIEHLGKIDIAVHAAGIAGPTGKRIEEISVEDYDRVYAVNQRSSFLIAKALLPHMEKNGYGRLVMLASMAGKDGNPGMAPYTSTKAAVIGLVKGLGKEYAQSGVTVNGIAPAVIRTSMNADTSEEQLAYMTAKIPMGRLGEVEEVANLAAWICSKEASFTTGFIYDLSGGRATY